MKRFRGAPLSVLTSLIVLLGSVGMDRTRAQELAGSGTPLAVGKPFPDRTLPSLEDGSPLSLRDFRGEKIVLLVFASW